MTRKRKQSNMVRNVVILALVIVLVIVVAAAYKSEQVPPNKDEASEYFAISGADYFPKTEIQTFGFNITAVRGDAHNVHVQCLNTQWELANPKKGGTILQGESVFVELLLSPPFPLSGISSGETFPFEISVTSTEAEGEIAILLQKR